LEYLEGKPVLIEECKTCGICANVCPHHSISLPELDRFVFGKDRSADQEFGIYRKLVVAQANDSKILNVSQDGGAVTALLLFALESGFIDGAVLSGVSNDKPLLPVPELSTTSEEICAGSGTRYFYSPNILALAEASKQKKTKVAFVGTPCQVLAVRRMQKLKLKLAEPVRLLVGLMCSECFTYEGLMDKLVREKLKLDLRSVRKMNIKGKMLVTTESGMLTIPLDDIKQYAHGSCRFCGDLSSELADISAGGLSLDKWTFTIIRTETGEKLLSSAEKKGVIRTKDVQEEPNALNLLIKMSRKKREKLERQAK
jgi:coenzyme F420 hydrogenase subunit beta